MPDEPGERASIGSDLTRMRLKSARNRETRVEKGAVIARAIVIGENNTIYIQCSYIIPCARAQDDDDIKFRRAYRCLTLFRPRVV